VDRQVRNAGPALDPHVGLCLPVFRAVSDPARDADVRSALLVAPRTRQLLTAAFDRWRLTAV
jgi:hypothetical protein